MEFSCIIVDDERLLRESLADFINRYCPGLHIAGKAASAEEARALLTQHPVDIIFCDIQMPVENGFDFLNSIDAGNYHIVFVTAYNQYALQAIRARAFDYLLKPVDTEELCTTVNALQKSIRQKRDNTEWRNEYRAAFAALLNELQATRDNNISHISISHATGISFVQMSEILFLEGDGGYTIVHLTNGRKIIATRILSDFEELLPEKCFFRIHKSTIVNLQYIKEFSRSEGFSVILNNGVQLTVGRRRVQDVLDRLQYFTHNI